MPITDEIETGFNIFAYGTLMFPEVASVIAGDVGEGQAATLNGFSRYEAAVRDWGRFPFIEPDERGSVDGLLFSNITARQLAQFDWFEENGSLYHREVVDSIVLSGNNRRIDAPVWAYIAGPRLYQLMQRYAEEKEQPIPRTAWSQALFRNNELQRYFLDTVVPAVNDQSYTRQFGRPDQSRIRRIIAGFNSRNHDH